MIKYKIIDLFAGAGGLSNGFEQTQMFEVIGAVEINNEATKTYIKNHGNQEDLIIKSNKNGLSDITTIDFNDIRTKYNLSADETIVIGGPPCQGFSNANRQKNYLISGNNQLVKEYARAIDELRPVAFLMENVKTMNSKTHKFFVTEHDETSILKYSSEKHLDEIIGEDGKKIWDEEELLIVESTDMELYELIKELTTQTMIQPILLEAKHISRVRGLMRKLSSKRNFALNNGSERKELKLVEDYLRSYNVPTIVNSTKLKTIINNTISIIEVVLDNKEINKETFKEKLQPFITINQMLRYIKELKDEKIAIVGDIEPIVKDGKIQVKVKVKSYNIVKYLEQFFKYLGYAIDHDVVKAVDFFVPQKRERYMFMGIRKDKLKESIELPTALCDSGKYFTVMDAIADLADIEPTKDVADHTLDYNSKQQFKMISYFRGGMRDSSKLYNHINTESEELSLQRFEAIKASGGKNFHSLSDELKDITYADSSRTQNTVYLRLNYATPSPTVINVRKSMWQHPDKIRAVSIREAARLQSFKDDFIFVGTKDKQYQQIGNAVPPLMARAVAEQMLRLLGHHLENTIQSEFK